MLNKYISTFTELVNNKNFKYAVDYMGIYFFGLIDNVSYTEFIERYYDSFIDFTNWLVEHTEPELFRQAYNDEIPLLYKLVDAIQDTNEQPDSLEEALAYSSSAIKETSKKPLYKLANDLLQYKSQIVLSLSVLNNNGEMLYEFEDKFTKIEQKNNPNMVIEHIVTALCLIIVYGGYIVFTLRDKGKEQIFIFEGYNGDSLRAFSEDEVENSLEDYIIAKKDIDVECRTYYLDKEKLN